MGYRERTHIIWKGKRIFDVKEQRLLDKKWQNVTKKGVFRLEIKRKLMDMTEEPDKNGCEGPVEFV